MRESPNRTPTIVGNVPVEAVTVNAKGGSLTAILKKGIREGLTGGAMCYGAKMEFAPGVSCVLMAPGKIGTTRSTDTRKFWVKRIANGRYIINFGKTREDTIDPLTKATLTILEEQLKAGKTEFISDADMKGRLSTLRKRGNRAVSDATQRFVRPK